MPPDSNRPVRLSLSVLEQRYRQLSTTDRAIADTLLAIAKTPGAAEGETEIFHPRGDAHVIAQGESADAYTTSAQHDLYLTLNRLDPTFTAPNTTAFHENIERYLQQLGARMGWSATLQKEFSKTAHATPQQLRILIEELATYDPAAIETLLLDPRSSDDMVDIILQTRVALGLATVSDQFVATLVQAIETANAGSPSATRAQRILLRLRDENMTTTALGAFCTLYFAPTSAITPRVENFSHPELAALHTYCVTHYVEQPMVLKNIREARDIETRYKDLFIAAKAASTAGQQTVDRVLQLTMKKFPQLAPAERENVAAFLRMLAPEIPAIAPFFVEQYVRDTWTPEELTRGIFESESSPTIQAMCHDVERLVTYLQRGTIAERVRVLQLLRTVKSAASAATPAIVELLAKQPAHAEKIAIINALERGANPVANAPLFALTTDPDPQVRAAATNAWDHVPGTQFPPTDPSESAIYARILAADTPALERAELLRTLPSIAPHDRAMVDLCAAMQSDPHRMVRLNALEIFSYSDLAGRYPEPAEKILVGALSDADFTVRSVALSTLALLPHLSQSTATAVEQLLRNRTRVNPYALSGSEVDSSALGVLLKSGACMIVPAMVDAYSSGHPDMRGSALALAPQYCGAYSAKQRERVIAAALTRLQRVMKRQRFVGAASCDAQLALPLLDALGVDEERILHILLPLSDALNERLPHDARGRYTFEYGCGGKYLQQSVEDAVAIHWVKAPPDLQKKLQDENKKSTAP